MTKVCFRCKKEITENDHYLSFTEYYQGKEVKIDYAHKVCWDNFLSNIKDVTEAKGMLKGLKNTMIRLGVLPMEQVEIK